MLPDGAELPGPKSRWYRCVRGLGADKGSGILPGGGAAEPGHEGFEVRGGSGPGASRSVKPGPMVSRSSAEVGDGSAWPEPGAGESLQSLGFGRRASS